MITGIIDGILSGLVIEVLKNLIKEIKESSPTKLIRFQSLQEINIFISKMDDFYMGSLSLTTDYSFADIIALYFVGNEYFLDKYEKQTIEYIHLQLEKFKNDSKSLNSTFIQTLNYCLAGRYLFLRNYKILFPKDGDSLTSSEHFMKIIDNKINSLNFKEAKKDVTFLMSIRSAGNFIIHDKLEAAVMYGQPNMNFTEHQRKTVLMNIERQKQIITFIIECTKQTINDAKIHKWAINFPKIKDKVRLTLLKFVSDILHVNQNIINNETYLKRDLFETNKWRNCGWEVDLYFRILDTYGINIDKKLKLGQVTFGALLDFVNFKLEKCYKLYYENPKN